jgi:hypothetical protein
VLFKLLGEPTEVVTYFNLQRYLKSHYIQVQAAATDAAPVTPVAPSAKKVSVKAEEPVAVASTSESAEKVKKKIMVKKSSKKESTQLSEE